MTDHNGDWTEERLTAAFTTRAAAVTPAPPGLIASVHDRIDAGRRSSPRHLAPLIGLAAVVAVAVIVGVGQLTQVGPSASNQPSGQPLVSATPDATASSVVDKPRISVSDALTIRTTGDDRELVVGGFLSPMPVVACTPFPPDRNPTRIACPEAFQWLMEQPEILVAVGQSSAAGRPPTGPAFHPLFRLVKPPDVPFPAHGPAEPVSVVLIGHFHDRRAALCAAETPPETPCGDVFIVDRVAAVNGQPRGLATVLRNQRFDAGTRKEVTEQPTDLVEDVDRLAVSAVPGGSILSRQLLTIDQVISVEPVLASDDYVPYVGNPATLVWIVTVLDPGTDAPRARTFALFDGSNWFAELTPDGAKHLERTGSAQVPSLSGAPLPSADPSAFDSAPTSIRGIEVRDVATVMRDRRADFGDLGRDEFAIRAWYVGPNPSVSCDPETSTIHPPTPPCDRARPWLLDRPEQLGSEVGQLRTNPEHWPPVLNPLLPVDVPFDVPATWVGGVASPQPVIVLGHFEDTRVDTYAGNVYFVLDALAWTRDRGTEPLDTVTRLSTAAAEGLEAVLARVAAASSNRAVATWATVVEASDFAALDPRAAERAPEFTTGSPVWIVRRLIANEMDGRQRLAVEWTLTADGGTRVWWTETPDSDFDLATSIDLHDIDPRTTMVRIFDYDQQIVSVRDVTPRDQLDWRFTVHKYMALLEVARGRTDREVAIRWTSGACDPEWRVQVNTRVDAPGVFIQPQTSGDYCPGNLAPRSIMLIFDHPVDLDTVRTTDEASSGGG